MNANIIESAPPNQTGLACCTFDQMLQLSERLAESTIIPAHFQKKPANILIALDMAQRMGFNPLLVMQNLYVVHGTPAWSGKFAIAMLNRSPKYKRIEYQFINGRDATDGMRVIGHRADDPEDKFPDVGTSITPEMVKKEGWGAKWQSMPEQMYRYRAAAFFVRVFCPELLMGLLFKDEAEDIQQTPRVERFTGFKDAVDVKAETPVATPPAKQAKFIETKSDPIDPIIAKFEALGVTKAQVAAIVNRPADGLTYAQLSQDDVNRLRRVYTKVKKGEIAPAELAAASADDPDDAASGNNPGQGGSAPDELGYTYPDQDTLPGLDAAPDSLPEFGMYR